MSRIVGFIGARPGVGVTSLCFELAKNIAKQDLKVCVIDFYFGMNDVSLKFDNDAKFDLKDYLIGKIGADGIVQEAEEFLYFIKSNVMRFDYLKFASDIQNLIKLLSFKFDYIFVDINNFDLRNLNLAMNVVTEFYLILDNESNSIRMATRLMKIIKSNEQAKNINLILNKSKIIGQIKRVSLSRKDVEEILNEDIIFEIPLFFNHNKNSELVKKKIMNDFCNSFITNKVLRLNYHKKYKGFIGKIRKRFYARFE